MNIYPEYRKVVINNTEIDLRKKEFDILYYLAINKGRVLALWTNYFECTGRRVLQRGTLFAL